MLIKRVNDCQRGFTIIEVLIVLAIAALILLVVFLAIPSLQRNSRNNQRVADVSALVNGVNEYKNLNNNRLPGEWTSTCSGLDGEPWCWIGWGTLGEDIRVDLSYYTSDQVQILGVSSGVEADGSDAAHGLVRIITGATCDGADAVPGPNRGFAVLFTRENNSPQCRAA